MKKINIIIFIGLVIMGASCKKYFDINTNTNSATSVTPDLILPQALRATATCVNIFNTYGAEVGGYAANAGGYGGFGESISYNFSSSTDTTLWSYTYDNLEDYQYIINNATTTDYSYFNAAARIMKVYDFQLLVDTYNSIPYSAALKGSDNLTPTYDDPATIYSNLASQIDTAIKIINAAASASGVRSLGSYDVLFAGNETKWKQFANTIKLRLMVKGNGKATFSNTSFDAAGFLSTDALINPGFSQDNNKQNPAWNTWGFSYTGGAATKSWIPTTYVFGFYDGNKLIDSARGRAIYYTFADSVASKITNKLGYENVNIPKCPTGSFWYSGTDRTVSAGNHVGILKGPNAGFPIMLASESYFLQAEAAVRGIVSGTAKTLFNSGITASFNYLYQLPDLSVSGSPSDSATAYIAENISNYLANFDLATTTAQQIEAIITQKYIALNFINSNEGWDDYRRTGYPAVITGGNGYQTFASTVSQSTRSDKLPARIMYPASEYSYNPKNVPSNISPFTSLIFWAK